jgi:opacity protein-like surface antigen
MAHRFAFSANEWNLNPFCIAVRTDKGTILRKFALFISACALALFPNLAAAQKQIDLMVGGSFLEAPVDTNDSVNFHQPQERNGLYEGFSFDVVGIKRPRLGFNVETAWRHGQAAYPYNGETYRPIFTDANVLFQPRLNKKLGADLFAGVGIATTRFNISPGNSCTPTAGCTFYTTSEHFMEDLGAGLRYRVWRRFFIRPEVHYYHIQNNFQFSSNNVFRVGGSIGYTFGSK